MSGAVPLNVTHSDSCTVPVYLYEQSRLKQQSSIPPLVVSCLSLQYTVFQMHSLLFCVLLIFVYVCGRHRSSDANLLWSELTKNILRESEIIIFYSNKYAFSNKGSKENLRY